jgi:N-acetylneuraminate synthase
MLLKLQTYRPDTITLDCDSEDFRIRGGLWDGRTLYDLYREAHMPGSGMRRFSSVRAALASPFSARRLIATAVDLLEGLNAPAYKIASFEAVDLPLIKYVASTGKPMIISTGMADSKEIQEAIDAARAGGCNELAVLHCVSGYPAPAADYNLRTIPDMISRFGVVTGLSDHTLDNATAIASVALGASLIEKHFKRSTAMAADRTTVFSLEPRELAALCQECVRHGRRSARWITGASQARRGTSSSVAHCISSRICRRERSSRRTL